MRPALLLLAAVLILGGDLLILATARTIPATVFAGGSGWAWVAALMIAAGIGLVLWVNLRRIA